MHNHLNNRCCRFTPDWKVCKIYVGDRICAYKSNYYMAQNCATEISVARLESLQNAQRSSSSPLYERFTSVQDAWGRNPPHGTNFPVWLGCTIQTF